MHEWAPEIRVDEPLARRLIREQFPEVEARSFRLLGEGWDTTVYLVDDRWTFRFPRKAMVIPGFRNEIAHLPRWRRSCRCRSRCRRSSANRQMSSWPFYGAPYLPGRELADALDDDARAGLALPLADSCGRSTVSKLDADLPLDPVRARTCRSVSRGPATGWTGSCERLWQPPPLVEELWSKRSASLLPRAGQRLRHGDLHLRHLLVGGDGAPGRGHRLDRPLAQRPGRRPDALLVVASGREPRDGSWTPTARSPSSSCCGHGVLRSFSAERSLSSATEGLPALEREAVASLDRASAERSSQADEAPHPPGLVACGWIPRQKEQKWRGSGGFSACSSWSCGSPDRRHHPGGMRTVGKTAAWILLILILPILGTIIYFLVNGAGGGGTSNCRDRSDDGRALLSGTRALSRKLGDGSRSGVAGIGLRTPG